MPANKLIGLETPEQIDAPERVWDRRRRLVSREIEDIALELFAEFGFEAVTVDQIATKAGIGVRTFFRYFPTKEDVLLADVQRETTRLCEELMARPKDEPLLDAFRNAIKATAVNDIRDENKRAQIWRGILKHSPEAIDRVRSSYSLTEQLTSTIATRLGVDPKVDLRPGVFANALAGAVRVSAYHWYRLGPYKGIKDRYRMMDNAFDILKTLGDA